MLTRVVHTALSAVVRIPTDVQPSRVCVNRRFFLLSTFAVACGPHVSPAEAPEGARVNASALSLAPLSRLCVLPRLEWLIEMKPKALYQRLDLFASLFTTARFEAFQKRFGFDLRSASHALVASYGAGLLWGAQAFVLQRTIASAFEARAQTTVRRTEAPGNIVSLEGVVQGEPCTMMTLGNEAVLMEERTTGGALRAASLLAQKRLVKTKPAIELAPLQQLRARLGEAEVLALAPGPFADAWTNAASGMLAAATALGGSLRVRGADVVCTMCILGVADRDADAAKTRALATLDKVLASDVARVAGLDHTKEPPRAHTEGDALWVEVVYDAKRLSEGIHRLLEGSAEELMRR